MRFLFLLFALTVTSASAQELYVADALELGLCGIRDVPGQFQRGFEEPYIAVNTRGIEIDRGGLPMTEGEALNVYLIGRPGATGLIDVRRTSDARDLDRLNIAGAGVSGFAGNERLESLAEDLRAEACAVDTRIVTDFAPPKGEVSFTVYDEEAKQTKTIGRSSDFGVRTLYVGGVTIGPYVSFIPARTYPVVENEEGEFILTKGGGDLDMTYALALEYYLGGPRVRGESGLGAYLAIPVTQSLGDNAIVGLTLDSGTLFKAHVGLRLGRVDRIVSAQRPLIGTAVAEEFAAETTETWRVGPTFGVSIDAGAAAEAFGKVFKALAVPQ